MFKKVSWIVALLAALSLAVVFVGCGPEPEAPPPPEFEEGDVLFSLADWIDENKFKSGDDITDKLSLPLVKSGGPGAIKVTSKKGLEISGRSNSWDTIDLGMDELQVYFKKYLFELEVSYSGSSANGYKICEPGQPYGVMASTEDDATSATLIWEVTDDYTQSSLRFQPTTNETATFTITALTLTYLGPREE